MLQIKPCKRKKSARDQILVVNTHFFVPKNTRYSLADFDSQSSNSAPKVLAIDAANE